MTRAASAHPSSPSSFARAALLALTLASCGVESRVTVLIDAQPGVRRAGAQLRVRVFGSDGALRLDDTREVGPETAWPLRLPLVPEGGDPSRTWVVEATLTNAEGAPLTVARARGGYVESASRAALLCLFDGCAAIDCGATEDDCDDPSGACLTCRGGECTAASATLVSLGAAPSCPTSDCVPTAATELACDDGKDDDCDGRIDCADPACGCDAGTCVPIGPEDTPEACSNGIDDDCDGTMDCGEGADCRFDEGRGTCNNGIDDDCDGQIDCMDSGCCADAACDQKACGPNGYRCCDGACVNTWASEQHCGGCGITCAGARRCRRVPDGSGGSAPGAACRCTVGAGQCIGGLTCERHDDVAFCNCSRDGQCLGKSQCHPQGAGHHAYCGIP